MTRRRGELGALGLVVLSACGGAPQAPPASESAPALHAGDRVGSHGMHVYGRAGRYVIDHIPMHHPPHDLQLVLRATLSIADDLSTAGHTLKPTETFSLDDLALGAIPAFTADLYRGNFESGGTLLHAGVTVTPTERVVARRLPTDDRGPPWLALDGFATRLLGGARPQEITYDGKRLACLVPPDFVEACP